MVRFNQPIWFVVLTVLSGCSAHLEPPQEQESRRVEQKQEQRQPSVPTFRYRPGGGLTIEGR
jgi:hypothetical protein